MSKKLHVNTCHCMSSLFDVMRKNACDSQIIWKDDAIFITLFYFQKKLLLYSHIVSHCFAKKFTSRRSEWDKEHVYYLGVISSHTSSILNTRIGNFCYTQNRFSYICIYAYQVINCLIFILTYYVNQCESITIDTESVMSLMVIFITWCKSSNVCIYIVFSLVLRPSSNPSYKICCCGVLSTLLPMPWPDVHIFSLFDDCFLVCSC